MAVKELDISLRKSYKYSMSILNKSGDIAFPPQTCKETFQRYFAEAYIFDQRISIYGQVNGDVARQKPPFVIFAHEHFRDEQAQRVLHVLNLLKTHFRLRKTPRVGLTKTGNAIVFTVDRWLYAHPVNVHFLLTMVRLVMCSAECGLNPPMNSLRGLVDWAIANRYNLHQQDGEQLNDSPNIKGILDKSLPCYKKRAFDSWFKARPDSPQYWPAGIVKYSPFHENDNIAAGTFSMNKLIELYPPVKASRAAKIGSSS